MKILFLLLIISTFILSGSSFADDKPNDGKSKEDKRFEAQSKYNTLKIIQTLGNLPFFQDGILTNTYKTTWSDGKTEYYADFLIETRVGTYDDQKVKARVLLIPIEIKLRGDITNLDNISPQNLKIGLMRLLHEEIGLTYQIFSFNFEKNERKELGQFIGFEFVDISFNDVIPLNKSETLELILKVSGSFSVGQGVDDSVIKQQKDSYKDYEDFKLFTGSSIGIRIHKKVLFSLFGDLIYDFQDRGGNASTERDIMYQKTLGAEIRYIPNDWFQFSLVGQKELYKAKSAFDIIPDPGGETGEISKYFEATSGLVNFEVHW